MPAKVGLEVAKFGAQVGLELASMPVDILVAAAGRARQQQQAEPEEIEAEKAREKKAPMRGRDADPLLQIQQAGTHGMAKFSGPGL